MAAPDTSHTTPITPAIWLHELYGTAEAGWLNIFTVNRDTGKPQVDWAPVDQLDALAA